jgi:hypothetical protein
MSEEYHKPLQMAKLEKDTPCAALGTPRAKVCFPLTLVKIGIYNFGLSGRPGQ